MVRHAKKIDADYEFFAIAHVLLQAKCYTLSGRAFKRSLARPHRKPADSLEFWLGELLDESLE